MDETQIALIDVSENSISKIPIPIVKRVSFDDIDEIRDISSLDESLLSYKMKKKVSFSLQDRIYIVPSRYELKKIYQLLWYSNKEIEIVK